MTSFSDKTKPFRTIIDFLRFGLTAARTQDLYYGHGTDNAWDDVYALVLGSLSLPLDCDPDLLQACLTESEKSWLVRQLQKRIQDRIPTAYLTNTAYFCGLPFYVDERVLIPRSPMGELIERQLSPWVQADQVHRILDVCTGSGCIAIACCYAFPHASVDASDISEAALEVAEINRARHGVEAQLELMHSDGLNQIPKAAYDLIISNPPYVSFEEMQSLPKEYEHEPSLALECDNHGLAIVETLLHHVQDYLSEHGILVMEVGNSEAALSETYPEVPFTWLEFERGGHGVFVLTKAQLHEYFSPS